MSYVNFQSDDIAFDIDIDGNPYIVRIAALGEAFLIETGMMIGDAYLAYETEIVPISEHAELAGLYIRGEWDLYGLELLLCPVEQGDVNLTAFAREQLAARAV